MKFLGLAAVALMTALSASAGTLAPIFCGGFSFSAYPGPFITSSNSVTSGTITCAPFNSIFLPPGDSFVMEQIILEGSYLSTSGNNSAAITFSPGTLAIVTDTVTATGASGPPTTWSDSFADPSNAGGFGASYFFDGSYTQTGSLPTLGGTIAYNVSLAPNSTIQEVSGNVFEYITYTTTTPEPATFGLVGSALLGLGLRARKRVSR